MLFGKFQGFAESGKRRKMIVILPSGDSGKIYPLFISMQKIAVFAYPVLPLPERRTQDSAPVATSFQFGSREETSRLKVQ
jgi:hypothetical protein